MAQASEAFERATQPKPLSDKDFLAAVLRKRGDLQEKVDSGKITPEFPTGGAAVTVILGDEVFKGARIPVAIPRVNLERRLLEHMMDCGLPFPEVTCFDEEAGFFGMTKTPGDSFYKKIPGMTPEELKNLAQEIARTVVGMAKAFTYEEATDVFGLWKQYPRLKESQGFMEDPKVQEALGGALPACKRLAQEYVDAFSKKKPVVMNVDVHTGNGFVDSLTNGLTGIIDFGDVRYCIPECVYMNALLNRFLPEDKSGYPEEFAKAFCAACTAGGVPMSYRHVVLQLFANDIDWFQTAVSKNYKEDIAEALQKIKGVIKKLDEMEADTPAQSPVTQSHRQRTRSRKAALAH